MCTESSSSESEESKTETQTEYPYTAEESSEGISTSEEKTHLRQWIALRVKKKVRVKRGCSTTQTWSEETESELQRAKERQGSYTNVEIYSSKNSALFQSSVCVIVT